MKPGHDQPNSSSSPIAAKTALHRSSTTVTWEECQDGLKHETWRIVTEGCKRVSRFQFSNFVIRYKNYVKGGDSANPNVQCGWHVEILAQPFGREAISAFLPVDEFASVQKFQKWLTRTCDMGGMLILNTTHNTSLKAYSIWKQTVYLNDPQASAKSQVQQLGLQDDGRTLILGENSVGIFGDPTPDGTPFTVVPMSESGYIWNSALGLADFGTKLDGDGSAMYALVTQNLPQHMVLNFCSVTGFLVSNYYANEIRSKLNCALPSPVLVGPTGALKTRVFEWAAALFGYSLRNERAWMHMNIVEATVTGIEDSAKKHPFALMLSDCKKMADLEVLTKQRFDGGKKVNRFGVKDIKNPVVYACNEKPLKQLFSSIEHSTKERMVILAQDRLTTEMQISAATKAEFCAARESFSANLPNFANPDPDSPERKELFGAFHELKQRFHELLCERGAEEQAPRISDSYALNAALGCMVHKSLATPDCGSAMDDIRAEYYDYFKSVQLDRILNMQIGPEESDATLIPASLTKLLQKFMQLHEEWHNYIAWPINVKIFENATCLGMKTGKIFDYMESIRHTHPEINALLETISDTKVRAWMKEKSDKGPRASMSHTINQFCNGTGCGEAFPVTELYEGWELIKKEAADLNHDPAVLKCYLQTKKANRKRRHHEIDDEGGIGVSKNGSVERRHKESSNGSAETRTTAGDGCDIDGLAGPTAQTTSKVPEVSKPLRSIPRFVGNRNFSSTSALAKVTKPITLATSNLPLPAPPTPVVSATSKSVSAPPPGRSVSASPASPSAVDFPSLELQQADDCEATKAAFKVPTVSTSSCASDRPDRKLRSAKDGAASESGKDKPADGTGKSDPSRKVSQGPQSSKTPRLCGVCDKHYPGNTHKVGGWIVCTTCHEHVHFKCTGRDAKEFNVPGNVSTFVCSKCAEA